MASALAAVLSAPPANPPQPTSLPPNLSGPQGSSKTGDVSGNTATLTVDGIQVSSDSTTVDGQPPTLATPTGNTSSQSTSSNSEDLYSDSDTLTYTDIEGMLATLMKDQGQEILAESKSEISAVNDAMSEADSAANAQIHAGQIGLITASVGFGLSVGCLAAGAYFGSSGLSDDSPSEDAVENTPEEQDTGETTRNTLNKPPSDLTQLREGDLPEMKDVNLSSPRSSDVMRPSYGSEDDDASSNNVNSANNKPPTMKAQEDADLNDVDDISGEADMGVSREKTVDAPKIKTSTTTPKGTSGTASPKTEEDTAKTATTKPGKTMGEKINAAIGGMMGWNSLGQAFGQQLTPGIGGYFQATAQAQATKAEGIEAAYNTSASNTAQVLSNILQNDASLAGIEGGIGQDMQSNVQMVHGA